MKLRLPLILLGLLLFLSGLKGSDNSRLIILADMGNEPDEMQQMIHMILCSNEFDLEGLIAVTGKFLRPGHRIEYKNYVHPELFLEIIDAYETVLPNLSKHAKGYPEPEYLRSIVKAGQTDYGIRDVGEGKTSEGAQLIIDALAKDDPRPIWVVVNAGSNTLAQALYVIKTTQPRSMLDAAIQKLRVFENGSQDNAGAWITSEFPGIHWIRSNYQTYAYGGPGARGGNTMRGLGPHQWKPFDYSAQGQGDWLGEHVQNNHGALGDLYPDRRFREDGPLAFMEGGGTIPWLGLVNKGMFSINHPHWGGWSGRFTREKVADFWSRHGDIRPDEELFAPFYTYREASDYWTNPDDGEVFQGDYVAIWRFRPAMYANFQARMDWCVKDFDEANHHPVAAVDGDDSNEIVMAHTHPGRTLSFNAGASSDPDGDELKYHWWIYQEAGNYAGKINLEGAESETVSLTIPTGARNQEIHLILEIQDDHPEVPLTDYRRIVIKTSQFELWHSSPQGRQEDRFDLLPIERE